MLQKIGQTLGKLRSMPIEVKNKLSKKTTDKKERNSTFNNTEEKSKEVKQQTTQGELMSAAILAKIGDDNKVINSDVSNGGRLEDKQQVIGLDEQAAIVKNDEKQLSEREKLNTYITKTMDDYKYPDSYNVQIKENPIDEKEMLLKMKEIQNDLTEALEHWKWTKHAYQHAVGFEQVEYCIYQMMAAEQKYRMILLKARNMNVDWSKVKGDMI